MTKHLAVDEKISSPGQADVIFKAIKFYLYCTFNNGQGQKVALKNYRHKLKMLNHCPDLGKKISYSLILKKTLTALILLFAGLYIIKLFPFTICESVKWFSCNVQGCEGRAFALSGTPSGQRSLQGGGPVTDHAQWLALHWDYLTALWPRGVRVWPRDCKKSIQTDKHVCKK